MSNQINWSVAKIEAVPMSAVRENGLVSFWCAGFRFAGHRDPALLGVGGKPNEYQSPEAAIAAAKDFVESAKTAA